MPPRACRRDVHHGICGLEPVYPDFHAAIADWYPADAETFVSRLPRGVPSPIRRAAPLARPGPWARIHWLPQTSCRSFVP